MAATIWVIEQGQYSDYRVVGVFSTKANAEEFLGKMLHGGFEHPSISEWPLDPNLDESRSGLTPYRVWMERDGNVVRVLAGTIDDKPIQSYIQRASAFNEKETLFLLTWATDDQHAIKICNERRTQLIALNLW